MEKEKQYIVYFPTKNNWKRPSHLSYIEAGLKTFVSNVLEHNEIKQNVQNVGIPALGAGLGGLDYSDVLSLLKEYLEPLEDYTFYLFPPKPHNSQK